MDPIQRAVANPPRKIDMQRAARRKVLGNIAPLAAGAQYIHHTVHHRPHVCPPFAAATSNTGDVAHVPTIINKITTNTVEIASIRIYATSITIFSGIVHFTNRATWGRIAS
jgi:hypothetical protein